MGHLFQICLLPKMKNKYCSIAAAILRLYMAAILFRLLFHINYNLIEFRLSESI